METDLRVLSDNEITQVHERTLSILAGTGVRVDTAQGRSLLKKAGADVNASSHVVRFPREMLEECLRLAPRQFTLGGRRPNWEFPLNANRCSLVADGGACFAIDKTTKLRREANFQDWLDATRMIDSLDDVGVYWSMVEAGLFQKDIGDYTNYLHHMLGNFSKHIQDSTHTVEESRWLLEVLGTVFGGRENVRRLNPFSFLITPISPLVFEAEHTDAYLALAEWGIPVAIMPMPMSCTRAASSVASWARGRCSMPSLCCMWAASPVTSGP